MSWFHPAGVQVRSAERALLSLESAFSHSRDGAAFEPSGDIVSSSLASLMDDSAGLENVIGSWRVRVRMSDGLTHSNNFDVLC